MNERIIKTLDKLSIGHWFLTERREETAELFFVKKALDTRRIKDTRKYKVTVFRDGEREGARLRGSTDTEILASDSAETVEKKLADAWFAAQFAMNPFFELPDAVQAPCREKTGEMAEKPLAESAGIMAKALFEADTREDAFLNSAEIFVSRTSVSIRSSEGTDVSYTDATVSGEFVVQCRTGEDVEMFHQFSYTELDTAALTAKAAEALKYVADRSVAQKTLKTGKYDLILCGEEEEVLLGYYLERANAALVFPKYSSWKSGDKVQGGEDGSISGEALELSLCATTPYDGEGIPMRDRTLVRDGTLVRIYGANRFCRYLGIEPTGSYSKFRCDNPGTESFAELKKNPCLWAVAFSDFQMDSFSGHFGGEIRLAYLIDGEHITPVTGGSVNGSLLEAQKELAFSTERYTSSTFEGPYAVRLKNVSVAGSSVE